MFITKIASQVNWKSKYIVESFHEKLTKSKVKTNDLVISRVIGDTIRCAIIPQELNNSNCGNAIIICPGMRMNSIFICYLFQSEFAQRALLRRKVGSAQSVVNTKVVMKMKVPEIPIELQNQFADIVRHINSLDLSALETQATTLKQSLTQELLA